jgi:hypothetical protein
MINAIDPRLASALLKLRKNFEMGKRIVEMETAGINVIIQPGPALPTSNTVTLGPKDYTISINSKGDDRKAVATWGIKGTTEENSLAHELGHVYFNYMINVKGKPLVGGPVGVTPDRWEEMLSEATSRRFDNFTRPMGVIVPAADARAESAWEILKDSFSLNPFH